MNKIFQVTLAIILLVFIVLVYMPIAFLFYIWNESILKLLIVNFHKRKRWDVLAAWIMVVIGGVCCMSLYIYMVYKFMS